MRPSLLAVLLWLMVPGCDSGGGNPAEPKDVVNEYDLTGLWTGSSSRGPCEDWTGAIFQLQQDGNDISGSVIVDGQTIRELSGHYNEHGSSIGVLGLPGDSRCHSFFYYLPETNATYAHGRLSEVWGLAQGRCCGTVYADVRLMRLGV